MVTKSMRAGTTQPDTDQQYFTDRANARPPLITADRP